MNNCGYCKDYINNTVILKKNTFLLCSVCIKKDILISKTSALKKYYLKNSDIINLKYLHLKNNNKMYIKNDIIECSINKYGSIDNINKKKR